MAFSIRSRAAHGVAPILLTTLCLITPVGAPPAKAESPTPTERQALAAALRQLDALTRLVEESSATTPVVAGARYHFDYPRLTADIARVRTGIEDYLAPSRAQPRDPDALTGQYTLETGAEPERQR